MLPHLFQIPLQFGAMWLVLSNGIWEKVTFAFPNLDIEGPVWLSSFLFPGCGDHGRRAMSRCSHKPRTSWTWNHHPGERYPEDSLYSPQDVGGKGEINLSRVKPLSFGALLVTDIELCCLKF